MKFLTALNIKNIPWVSHGFFTRRGGGSTGIYAGLNVGLGSGDNPDVVRRNRAEVAAGLGVEPQALLTAYQCHSAEALYVDRPWNDETARPKVDALVTDVPGLAVGALAADCAPILFACDKTPVVAAAHAGWRGALSGVIEATLDLMEQRGARRADIHAAVGPCIGPASYEVSEDFKKPFTDRNPAHAAFFKAAARPGHLMFDLPGYVAARLAEAGVGHVHMDAALDTLSHEDDFYSFRRTTLRGEPDYGRQISAIAIKPI